MMLPVAPLKMPRKNMTNSNELTREYIASILPQRYKDSHKGMNGHALLCVGSDSYIGAALLCAKAASRVGSGLVTVVTTKEARRAFCAFPEAISISTGTDNWNDDACKTAIANFNNKQAIGIGCGMGDCRIGLLIDAIIESNIPAVIDADGLNFLSKNKGYLQRLHSNIVLTPHLKEMSRLIDEPLDKIKANPYAIARDTAKRFGCIVVLKSATSYISDGKSVMKNNSGNSGLAKGGSGDVLCGLIVGMLAQGAKPFDAACIGSYLLGIAAEDALSLLKERMLTASDVIDAIEKMSFIQK